MSSPRPQRSVMAIDRPGYHFLAEDHMSVFREGDALVRLLQEGTCSNPVEEVRSYLERHAQAMGQHDTSMFRFDLYMEALELEPYVLVERLEKLMQVTWFLRGRFVAANDQLAASFENLRRPGSR